MAASHKDDKDRAATRVTGAKPLDEIERDIAANTRAFVVGPYLQKRGVAVDANQRSFAARLRKQKVRPEKGQDVVDPEGVSF